MDDDDDDDDDDKHAKREREETRRGKRRGRTFERSDGVFNPPRVAVEHQERDAFFVQEEGEGEVLLFATAGGKDIQRRLTKKRVEKSARSIVLDRCALFGEVQSSIEIRNQSS